MLCSATLRAIIFEEKEKKNEKKRKKNALIFWERRNEDKIFDKKILPDKQSENDREDEVFNCKMN
jgi:hypothetical protein